MERQITREELESLYAGDGISRRELRILTRSNPDKIVKLLSDELIKKLSALRVKENADVVLRGFLHAPSRRVTYIFNQLSNMLRQEHGDYELVILSSSPLSFDISIPLVVPKSQVYSGEFNKASFVKCNAKIENLNKYNSEYNARFLVSKELTMLTFDELFSITEPDIKIGDIKEMFASRLNAPEAIYESIVYWLFSSPLYEGRSGGNAFSPVLSSDFLESDIQMLECLNKDLIELSLPYFSDRRVAKAGLSYLEDEIVKLQFFRSKELFYKLNVDLSASTEFLLKRGMIGGLRAAELNISTEPLDLRVTEKKPIESFITNPIIPAKVLNSTDIPLLLAKDELNIDDAESEIFDYSLDINHFVYLSRLRIQRVQLSPVERMDATLSLIKLVRREWEELSELLEYGIIFDGSVIGGLGEHLTRIAHAVLRSTEKNSIEGSIEYTKRFYSKMLSRLRDVIPAERLLMQLEEAKYQKYKERSYRLRDAINTILFELHAIHPQGWTYKDFEGMVKKRTDLTLAKVRELFKKLIEEREIVEISQGLYQRILGFDRYL